MNLFNTTKNSATSITALGLATLVVLVQLSSNTIEAALLRNPRGNGVAEEKGERKKEGQSSLILVGAKEKTYDSSAKRFLKSQEEELLGDISLEKDDYLLAKLDSDECSSFMESIGQATVTFLEYDDDAILEYVCNPIQLRQITRKEEKMEQQAVANYHDENHGTLSCPLAFEMMLIEHKQLLLDAFSSPENCKEKISQGIAAFRDTRRTLFEVYDLEGNDRRELSIITVVLYIMASVNEWLSENADAVVGIIAVITTVVPVLGIFF